MPKLYFGRTGHADLPLHYGQVPPWLAQRMSLLGGAIIEAIALDYGKSAVYQAAQRSILVSSLGLCDGHGLASRRYHWHSAQLKSFLETPHTSIYGKNQGIILNLTDEHAAEAKSNILNIINEDPVRMFAEIKKVVMPSHHDVKATNVNLKRLGTVLALAHEKEFQNFESFLLIKDIGPRPIQSLALVSEVIHGSPSRFDILRVFHLRMEERMDILSLCRLKCMMKQLMCSAIR